MRSKPTFVETARRTQLVGCAVETIAELGFAQASVRKIADRAGVAMSVVLYHFGSKDALVAAVVSECYRLLLATMEPALEAADTAQSKLAAHIRAHIEFIGSHRAHQVALMAIANDFRGAGGARLADLEVAPEHRAALARVDLESIFRAGVESGEFRALSPNSLATAVRGSIGAAVLTTAADPAFDVAAYGEDLVTAFLLAAAR